MPMVNVLGVSAKHNAMQDTWGHMYPEPGSKHKGTIVVTAGEYGDQVVINSHFPTLDDSPQRFHLEQHIFDQIEIDPGSVVQVDCTLWFYKTSNDMYMGERIGKIINIKTKTLVAAPEY